MSGQQWSVERVEDDREHAGVLLLLCHEELERTDVCVAGLGETGGLKEVRAVPRFSELEDGKRPSQVMPDVGIGSGQGNCFQSRVLSGSSLEGGLPSFVDRWVHDHLQLARAGDPSCFDPGPGVASSVPLRGHPLPNPR